MLRAIPIGLMTAALALAACGKDDQTTTEKQVAPPIGTTTAPPISGRLGKVPDVVGKRLPAATRRLDELGLHYQVTSATGAVRGGSNWEVCRTNPPAGLEIPVETVMELVVARPGRC